MSLADELRWLNILVQIWREQSIIEQTLTPPPSRMKAPA
jgi:hypothetical protein